MWGEDADLFPRGGGGRRRRTIHFCAKSRHKWQAGFVPQSRSEFHPSCLEILFAQFTSEKDDFTELPVTQAPIWES